MYRNHPFFRRGYRKAKPEAGSFRYIEIIHSFGWVMVKANLKLEASGTLIHELLPHLMATPWLHFTSTLALSKCCQIYLTGIFMISFFA